MSNEKPFKVGFMHRFSCGTAQSDAAYPICLISISCGRAISNNLTEKLDWERRGGGRVKRLNLFDNDTVKKSGQEHYPHTRFPNKKKKKNKKKNKRLSKYTYYEENKVTKIISEIKYMYI